MPYVELHAHSCFSLLDGASTPEALVERAAQLGMAALALTDHDAVYGAARFSAAARSAGIRPIFGAELTLCDDSHLTLLAADATGWANLCALITLGRGNADKGSARLPDDDALFAHADGLIALSGCRQGRIARAIRSGDNAAAKREARTLIEAFSRERTFIELHNHLLPGDAGCIAAGVQLADRLGIGAVGANNVHYAERDGHLLQDVLTCIRHNVTLDDAAPLLRPNSEYFLKNDAAMRALFPAYPDAIAMTERIAGMCGYELAFGLQDLPTFPTDGEAPGALLRRLCDAWLVRGNDGTAGQIAHELAVIDRVGLGNYFLIVWDIVRWSRENGIRCQGRGSAANSLVAYALGISPINPLEHDLVFERFLSDERRIAPDIDIDFDAARREEVIQYIYARYGHDHAAMACTFVTFRARSALRDVGKALGLPPDLLDEAAGGNSFDPFASAQSFGQRRAINLSEHGDHGTWAHVIALCNQIDGLPRHLGIHNGGMILTGAPIHQRLPTEPATMPGRVVVQWDKEALEDAGLVKIDILGLRMLSAISDAVQMTGADVDALAFDDPDVYGMVSAADTIGVFQVESRAQQQVLPRMQPRQFADLIVSISLIRPGPIQGNMVHPYLRRRLGEEAIRYPHPSLEPALRETLGVILFQEQVIKVARDLAGFSAGQGELLRRALGSKRPGDAVDRLHDAFIDGAGDRGIARAAADAVFDTLRAFGGYSFPKSHAAAFAVLVYQSAWLKRYHPAEFICALLNNQPMGFWSPAVIVGDARRHGIRLLPVHVNHSAARSTVADGAIRIGLATVKGLGTDAAQHMVNLRETGGAFRDLHDLAVRTRLPKRLIENLIAAGGCDNWGRSRRALLWELGTLDARPDTMPFEQTADAPDLPDLSPLEALGAEYAMMGLTVGDHPMVMQRAALNAAGILGSRGLQRQPDGARVRAAGLVVVHQAPPTAKGMHFITLEDEDGFINTVWTPPTYARLRAVVRGAAFLVVDGVVERRGGVVNVKVEGVSSIS